MKRIPYLLMGFLLIGCGDAVDQQLASEMALEPEPPAMPLPGEMVLIPAGEFIMGSDDKPTVGLPLAAPEHKRELPAFYIDAFEVTNGEFIRFATESGYRAEGDWRQLYSTGREDHPVANLSWEDARAYCEWAGKRLPTEAEWEKAARGPDGLPYPWGDKYDPTKSNVNETGFQNTVDVRRFEDDRSPYGVYGMMGNVQEWTADVLQPYPGSPVPRADAFQHRPMVVRGASYALRGNSVFLWSRSAFPKQMLAGFGCRCARDTEETAQAGAQ